MVITHICKQNTYPQLLKSIPEMVFIPRLSLIISFTILATKNWKCKFVRFLICNSIQKRNY